MQYPLFSFACNKQSEKLQMQVVQSLNPWPWKQTIIHILIRLFYLVHAIK